MSCGDGTGLAVRPMRPDDLDAVVAAMGQREFFTKRLGLHATGHGIMLIAVDWSEGLGGRVRGDVYVWFAAADEDVVRRHLPGVPVLNHLEVDPAYRGRGIGTELIRAAERLVTRHGHRRVAIGVGVDNPRARALYERLGYREWVHGLVDTSYETHLPDGSVRRFPETIAILVKEFRPRSP